MVVVMLRGRQDNSYRQLDHFVALQICVHNPNFVKNYVTFTKIFVHVHEVVAPGPQWIPRMHRRGVRATEMSPGRL